MQYQYKNPEVLKRFMEEQFDLETLAEIGFIKPESKGNYEKSAHDICRFFGYECIYEYGWKDSSPAHISFATEGSGGMKSEVPDGVPFAWVAPSWLRD